MAEDLRTYTQRVTRITAILESHLHVNRFVLATPEANPLEEPDGLACRWFDRSTAQPRVSVFIGPIFDIERTLVGLREEVTGDGPYEPGMASEISGLGRNEYVFLRHYANDVTGIVGNCHVSIHCHVPDVELIDLVDDVLEIGHTVGCSPYINDFVRPEYPDHWPQFTWGSPPFPPLRPPD